MGDKPIGSPQKASASVCASTYKILLNCSAYNHVFDYMSESDSASHIVDIFETAQCDHINDLSSFRADLTRKLNREDSKRTARILQFHDLYEDRSAAKHVVTHYKDFHQNTFRSALWNARWVQATDLVQWLQDLRKNK